MKVILQAIVVSVLVNGALWISLRAQTQKAERGTQQWEIPLGDQWRHLTVIDTAGVCLYVYHGYSDGEGGIVAVPKTHLPQGTGCQ